MSQCQEQARSTIYLGLILVIIWVLGIEIGLFTVTVISCTVALLSFIPKTETWPTVVRTFMTDCKELSGVLLMVFLIRSFVLQPFRVPTGSLEPTVKPGDFILVKQWAYGGRMPVWHHKLWGQHLAPHRGDIVLFYWPVHPEVVFVKRIVGLPGDTISYQDKKLLINGNMVPQLDAHAVEHENEFAEVKPMIHAIEQLPGHPHAILLNPSQYTTLLPETWVIPQGHYFVMGDNRDNSDDSRYWGLVPDRNLIGQASWIWMSYNPAAWIKGDYKHVIRFNRIGRHLS
jgi:signal peptidase I